MRSMLVISSAGCIHFYTILHCTLPTAYPVFTASTAKCIATPMTSNASDASLLMIGGQTGKEVSVRVRPAHSLANHSPATTEGNQFEELETGSLNLNLAALNHLLSFCPAFFLPYSVFIIEREW